MRIVHDYGHVERGLTDAILGPLGVEVRRAGIFGIQMIDPILPWWYVRGLAQKT